MNSYKDALLARLRNGESIDDLARELTNTLNEANKEYESTNQKTTDGNELVDMINYYITTYYDNFGQDKQVFTRETLETICDEVAYLNGLFESVLAKSKKTKGAGGDSNDEDVLAHWVRELR